MCISPVISVLNFQSYKVQYFDISNIYRPYSKENSEQFSVGE